MSTTISAAIVALSKELGDYWSSTTTAAGDVGKTYLVDDSLYEKVADWVLDGMVIYLPLGPTGAGSPETRVANALTNNQLSAKVVFSAQVQSGVAYEVHRLFTRSEKSMALLDAAYECFPSLHEQVRNEEFMSASDQYEYDLTPLGLWNNQPHQVWLEQDPAGAPDSPYMRLHDWTVTPEGHLLIPYKLPDGYLIRIVGIKPLLFVDDTEIALDSPSTKILYAQAALTLIQRKILSAANKEVDRWLALSKQWQTNLTTYKALYRIIPPDGTIITGPGLT